MKKSSLRRDLQAEKVRRRYFARDRNKWAAVAMELKSELRHRDGIADSLRAELGRLREEFAVFFQANDDLRAERDGFREYGELLRDRCGQLETANIELADELAAAKKAKR